MNKSSETAFEMTALDWFKSFGCPLWQLPWTLAVVHTAISGATSGKSFRNTFSVSAKTLKGFCLVVP